MVLLKTAKKAYFKGQKGKNKKDECKIAEDLYNNFHSYDKTMSKSYGKKTFDEKHYIH